MYQDRSVGQKHINNHDDEIRLAGINDRAAVAKLQPPPGLMISDHFVAGWGSPRADRHPRRTAYNYRELLA